LNLIGYPGSLRRNYILDLFDLWRKTPNEIPNGSKTAQHLTRYRKDYWEELTHQFTSLIKGYAIPFDKATYQYKAILYDAR